MKNTFLLLVFLSVFSASATHILNSYLQTEYKDTSSDGKLIYTIRLYAERTCGNNSIVFPDEFSIGVYRKDNGEKEVVNEAKLVKKLSKTDCYGICIEEAVYETTVLLPKRTSGYDVITLYCCRAETSNLPNDQNGAPFQGSMPHAFISGIPQPSKLHCTIPGIVMMDPFSTHYFSYELENENADSIVLLAVTPNSGGSLAQSFPSMPDKFPGFTNVTYQSGYSATFPFGNSSVYSFDMQNKILSLKGTLTGNYALAYRIKSFLKQKLIQDVYKEIHVYISNSPYKTKPIRMNGWVDASKTGIVNWAVCNAQATHYILERSEVSTNNFQLVDTFNYYQNFYYDNTISAGKEYFYRIRAERPNHAAIFSDTCRLIYWNSSIDGNANFNGLVVYPQPGKDKISIEYSGGFLSAFHICELSGKMVKQANFPGLRSPEQIDISDLKPGLYYLILYSSNGNTIQSKLIKE